MAKTTSRVGIIGCGNISDAYLKIKGCSELLAIAACADADSTRAREKAKVFGIPKACGVDELLNDPDIDIVLNLTPPDVHVRIGLAAIRAGKSVYSEKPLGIDREEARVLLEAARSANLAVGCAPDTFLGRGVQTCRRVIEEGRIGRPVAATAFVMSHGHESWHPDPEMFYRPGGGPLFDLGIYYLTALVTLLGPARAVSGMTQTAFSERVIPAGPRQGEKIAVSTPTHITGTVRFADDVTATVISSFDTWGPRVSQLEIYGTEGTLQCPVPVKFGGPVRVWTRDAREWEDIPLVQNRYTEIINDRGIGLLEMAEAIQTGRSHQANGGLAYHVLDMMCAFYDSARERCTLELKSTPAAFF